MGGISVLALLGVSFAIFIAIIVAIIVQIVLTILTIVFNAIKKSEKRQGIEKSAIYKVAFVFNIIFIVLVAIPDMVLLTAFLFKSTTNKIELSKVEKPVYIKDDYSYAQEGFVVDNHKVIRFIVTKEKSDFPELSIDNIKPSETLVHKGIIGSTYHNVYKLNNTGSFEIYSVDEPSDGTDYFLYAEEDKIEEIMEYYNVEPQIWDLMKDDD